VSAPRVVVLDYGSGNLRSAQRALSRVGAEVTVTGDPEAACEADGLVVPGVGAFAACMAGLHRVRGHRVVERLRAPVLPHIGWNTVDVPPGSILFAGVERERFYFVHSYGVRRWDLSPSPPFPSPLVTWAEHGERFVAAVENGELCATQFHPEKSGDAGVQLLENWVRSVA
jgi:glutamine amidotransferase